MTCKSIIAALLCGALCGSCAQNNPGAPADAKSGKTLVGPLLAGGFDGKTGSAWSFSPDTACRAGDDSDFLLGDAGKPSFGRARCNWR